MKTITLFGTLMDVSRSEVRHGSYTAYTAKFENNDGDDTHHFTVNSEEAKQLGGHIEEVFKVTVCLRDEKGESATDEEKEAAKARAESQALDAEERRQFETLKQLADRQEQMLKEQTFRLHAIYQQVLGPAWNTPEPPPKPFTYAWMEPAPRAPALPPQERVRSEIANLIASNQFLGRLLETAGFRALGVSLSGGPSLSATQRERLLAELRTKVPTRAEAAERIRGKIQEMVQIGPRPASDLPFGEDAWPKGSNALQITICGIAVLTASSREMLRRAATTWEKRLGEHLQQIVPILPLVHVEGAALLDAEAPPPQTEPGADHE